MGAGPLLLVPISGSKPSDTRCDRVADRSGLDAEPSLGFRAVDNEWLRELVQHFVEFAKGRVEHAHQAQQESRGYADLERGAEFRTDHTDDLAGGCSAGVWDVKDLTQDVVARAERGEGSRRILGKRVAVD